MKKFLDANVIIRYLTKDDPDQAARTYYFLQRVEKGKEVVGISEAILAEVVYVLSSKRMYNYPRAEIVKRLLPVVRLKGLRVPNRKMFIQVLELYAQTNIDFVDVLTVVRMRERGIPILVSFDHDFDKFPFIKREEPTLPTELAA